jgi:hypothetical protein
LFLLSLEDAYPRSLGISSGAFIESTGAAMAGNTKGLEKLEALINQLVEG